MLWSDVLKQVEPQHEAVPPPGGYVLLRELVSFPNLAEATSNPAATPHMSAAHAYIQVCIFFILNIFFIQTKYVLHPDVRPRLPHRAARHPDHQRQPLGQRARPGRGGRPKPPLNQPRLGEHRAAGPVQRGDTADRLSGEQEGKTFNDFYNFCVCSNYKRSTVSESLIKMVR